VLSGPGQNVLHFTPLADGKPALQGRKLGRAQLGNKTLLVAINPKGPGLEAKTFLFQLPSGALLAEYKWHPIFALTLSQDGRLLAQQCSPFQVEICPCSDTMKKVQSPMDGFHPDVPVLLGERWLALRTGTESGHLLRWDQGRLVHSRCTGGNFQTYRKSELAPEGLNPDGVGSHSGQLPPAVAYDPERFLSVARSNLVAVVDKFGQVFLFSHKDDLVGACFAFRERLAVWLPDGTCYGAAELLGRQASPNALKVIGERLLQASQTGKEALR